MENATERGRGNPTFWINLQGKDWYNWALARNGIYFFDPSSGIKFFDFATGKRISIPTADKSGAVGLAVSPDGRSILYVQDELAESSIMWVKNFR